MADAFLIVGLGNPGKTYEKTRHNIGFRVVEDFAKSASLSLRKKLLSKERFAQGTVHGKKVFILQPGTYMNLSGDAVIRAMRKHAIDIERLLVVCDDVALPFGQIRLRESGGSGGHNGLKSIEAVLGTNGYARLRIGVGDREQGDLADYVLSPFTPTEEKAVPRLIEGAVQVAEVWLTEGITSAMNRANAKRP